MKVDLEQIEFTAKSVGIDSVQIQSLVDDLRKAAEEEKALRDSQPREKKRLVILANIEGLPDELEDILASIPMVIIQYPEDGDHNQIVPSIHKVAYEFNAEQGKKRKRRKKPVSKVFETVGEVTSKYFKSAKIQVKTKEPVIVLSTDNELPTELPEETETTPARIVLNG